SSFSTPQQSKPGPFSLTGLGLNTQQQQTTFGTPAQQQNTGTSTFGGFGGNTGQGTTGGFGQSAQRQGGGGGFFGQSTTQQSGGFGQTTGGFGQGTGIG